MANKMMITGKVVKKPEHIELGKYNITVQTSGGREITVMVDSEGIDERILSQKVRGILNDMKREGDMRGGML